MYKSPLINLLLYSEYPPYSIVLRKYNSLHFYLRNLKFIKSRGKVVINGNCQQIFYSISPHVSIAYLFWASFVDSLTWINSYTYCSIIGTFTLIELSPCVAFNFVIPWMVLSTTTFLMFCQLIKTLAYQYLHKKAI